jgi:hypothetical protein
LLLRKSCSTNDKKNKDWLARSESGKHVWVHDISTRGLLFQWASIVGLKQSGHQYHFIECNLFSSWYSWTFAHLALNNNHSHIFSTIRSAYLCTDCQKKWNQAKKLKGCCAFKSKTLNLKNWVKGTKSIIDKYRYCS